MKHKKPLVSVLIPCYNAAKTIDRAINSILNQTYDNLEILVCDDSSTDNTNNILNKKALIDHRIKVYKNLENSGYLKTMNFLFTKSTGDLITTQDADDWSDKERIAKQVSIFTNDEHVKACLTGFSVINEKDNIIQEVSDIESLKNEVVKNYYKTRFNINSILFSKKILNEIGGYNLYFEKVGAEDYYWFHLIQEKYKIGYVNEPLYKYSVHSNSFTANPKSFKQLVISNLLIFLIKQRERYGDDGLSNSEYNAELLNYESKLTEKYNSKYLLDFVYLFKQFKARNYSKVLYLLLKKPFLLITISSLLKTIKLLKIRKLS